MVVYASFCPAVVKVFFFFFFVLGRGKKSDIIPLLTGVCPVGSRGKQ